MKLFRISLNKIFLFGVLAIGCAKEDTPDTLEDGVSKVIYDLAGDTGASVSTGIPGKDRRTFYPFLFDLEEARQIWVRTAADSARWLKTNDWHLAFTDNYNSRIFINNNADSSNPGFEGVAEGTAIVLLHADYDAVREAPSDAEFDQSTFTDVSWANEENSPGWYSYNSSTHIMKSLPNRTYALRLANGKYAKLQLISAYKGNPPAVTDQFWPAPYLTFRYFIQEDGSRNLSTR
ncbi:HmuY family protein [Sphingobacterium corticis]|uniref:HmuY family protein n=1 Tax=Sphingobacterium corticis TaxID=1812823 RepID=A0ABW5NMS3_9SPHI